jgi:ketosteroid isomerase-like protein
MSTEDTKAVLDHHSETLAAGDLDGLMDDYTEDSVFISNLGGVAKGLDAIRANFAALTDGLPGHEPLGEHVDGDIAYVWWKADGIAFGTDTFLVQDGKIVTQTVGLHFA